ncbi:MAG: hypothetical protein FWC73_13665 [Defluviitaleaceae bacterium]|nr:hypothetical protein [Defluviitaleaceae bacterium]
MKVLILNIMATTGLSVIVLAIVVRFLLQGYDLYFSIAVLQTFGANIAIHIGFLLTRLFESMYVALEIFIDILYTTIVLVVFGMIFDWFGIIPIWTLVIMAVMINLLALFLNMVRFKSEVNVINKLLRVRNKSEEQY